ncbi:MAG: hypothetical protein Q9224_003304 [Gallowayella concinna]
MPQSTVSHRPQTSKQAKRAYQKAGGAPRISAAQQRHIERAAELQERAERIRLHNLRAKENKRRKAEKLEKEREARKRMGIDDPVKNDVGSSQLRLGAFVIVGKKPRKEEICPPASPFEDREDTAVECAKTEVVVHETVSLIKPEYVPLQSGPTALCSPPKTPIAPLIRKSAPTTVEKQFAPQPQLMPPPPRPPLKKVSLDPMAHPSFQPPKVVPICSVETDWDLFLDSNTQVEREISGPQPKPLPDSWKPIPQILPSACRMYPTSILTNISTQDLQSCSSPRSPPKDDPGNNEDFLCGIEDEDLDGLTQAAILDCGEKVVAPSVALPPPLQRKQTTFAPHENSWPHSMQISQHSDASMNKTNDITVTSPVEDFDDYDFSSQELPQHGLLGADGCYQRPRNGKPASRPKMTKWPVAV